MIMPSDKEYRETKQIMLGNAAMKPEFLPLAQWIDHTYGVKTINILCYTRDVGKSPYLEICFETFREKLLFSMQNGITYSEEKQLSVARKFLQTLQDQEFTASSIFSHLKEQMKQTPNLAQDIWVVFSAFEPVARIDANLSIPQAQLDKLVQSLRNNDLWDISRGFSEATFFVYTDDQVKQYENSDTHKEWADKYFDLLEPYNVFGYFKRENFSVHLDSKENFDKNYQSNWYYYYK